MVVSSLTVDDIEDASGMQFISMLWHVLHSFERRKIGLYQPYDYKRVLCRRLGTELRVSKTHVFGRVASRIDDAHVRDDRMIIVDDKGHNVVVYELPTRTGHSYMKYRCMAKSRLGIPNRRMIARHECVPCVRWSPEGTFFTTTGTRVEKNVLRIIDINTMDTIETLPLEPYGSQDIFIHEHSEMNPDIIAVGTTLHKVLMVDLRTGNVTLSTSGEHTSRVMGIGWSLWDENLIVSSSDQEVLVWDKRYLATKSGQLQLPQDHAIETAADIKFLNRMEVLIMNSRTRIHMYNVYTGSTIDVFDGPDLRGNRMAFKFALNRDGKMLYYPVKHSVRGIDLRTRETFMDSEGGHVYPIQMLHFNERTKDLYSLNDDEAMVWTPFR